QRRYCTAVNTVKLRELSAADARALAAADVLAAALATDEWPLRHVAGQLLGGPEGVQLFTSVGVMHLMERAGKLTRDMRITTMRGWLASGEALHRQCGDEYRDCFGEEPPDGQSASSHKA
ncbi:MAG: hypothetical protein JWP52_966, partial [Rhizobacter sp.]|nr:hypothetical protein [Rhizobacter sp.]